jgi:hypothetical protein
VRNTHRSIVDALQVLSDHPQLHYGGYGPLPRLKEDLDQPNSRSRIMQPESLELILKVADWCSASFEPGGKKIRGCSYNLKHTAEKDLDQYVSNGELITGMLLAGCTISERGYNPHFKTGLFG